VRRGVKLMSWANADPLKIASKMKMVRYLVIEDETLNAWKPRMINSLSKSPPNRESLINTKYELND